MDDDLESGKSQADEVSEYFSDDDGLYGKGGGIWGLGGAAAAARAELYKYVWRPFMIGAAAAFGMSVGYALFDWSQKLVSRNDLNVATGKKRYRDI
ncbi:hypothetical protein FVE85_1842 [Porphyridium purpureum]|uniref:Uncharacterized protein n=1 Tax=Porphyridium purpureum TaxID=35688 RepID=A0A5J4YYZ5_PORPP|nr:hypothetical protein FVE85_1842 [Porphyridium purpureum]|eukprot:POR4717..scf209_3